MSVFFIFAKNQDSMIAVIGADGFLGRRMAERLWEMECRILTFGRDLDEFFRFLPSHYQELEWVLYVDRRVPDSTTSLFRMEYVQKLWTLSASYSLPLLYAFHQPTDLFYSDFHSNHFPEWTRRQYRKPPFWYIFKASEVYGPGESSSGELVSRVYAFYQQIKETGELVIPQPKGVDLEVGEARDYLYVQDAVRVFLWFLRHRPVNGVYDLGSGFERTDSAVAHAIFRALKCVPKIRYVAHSSTAMDKIDSPFLPDLRDLRRTGYKKPFFSVEMGLKSSLRKRKVPQIPLDSDC